MNKSVESSRNDKETDSQLDQPIAALAKEIADGIPYAVDALEIAAVLESWGITDDVTRERFGAATTFDLAQTVLPRLRVIQPLRRQPPAVPLEPEIPPWRDYLHGFWLMIGYGIVLLAVRYYGTFGNLSAEQVIALSLGITSGMFLANGFSYAMSRRTSIYWGLGQRQAAIHFLQRTMRAGVVTVIGATVCTAFLVAGLAPWPVPEETLFFIGFGVWSIIGVFVAGLALMRASQWFVISMTAGTIAGIAVDQISQPFTEAHLWIGTLCSLVIILAILWLALKRAFAKSPRIAAQAIRLPSIVYLVYEAAPYFIYGLVSMLFILMPRLLGWLSWSGQGPENLQRIYDLEIGLTLSAPPLILGNGVLERVLRLFWREIAHAQATHSGLAPQQFGVQVSAFYKRQLLRYGVILMMFSVVVAGLFEYTGRNAGLAQWLALPNLETVAFVFYGALLIYGVAGWGLFNGMFCLTLARPLLMVKAMLLGLAALVLVSLAFGLHKDLASVLSAFMAGALVLTATSTWSTYQLLKSADYYFYSLV